MVSSPTTYNENIFGKMKADSSLIMRELFLLYWLQYCQKQLLQITQKLHQKLHQKLYQSTTVTFAIYSELGWIIAQNV